MITNLKNLKITQVVMWVGLYNIDHKKNQQCFRWCGDGVNERENGLHSEMPEEENMDETIGRCGYGKGKRMG